MKISKRSIITKKLNTMDLDVTVEQLNLYLGPNPPLIQHCFPNLSAEEREFILSGITPEEWKEHIGIEEEG